MIIAALIAAVPASVTGFAAYQIGQKATDSRNSSTPDADPPLKPGYWAFRIENELEGFQFFGVFEIRYEGMSPRIPYGNTWVAGAPPTDLNKWGYWNASLTTFDQNHLFSFFQLRMQFRGSNGPKQDLDAILRLQRRDERSLSGHYDSFRLKNPRYGPMEAWFVGSSATEAERSAYESYHDIPINEQTYTLLADARGK